MTNPLLIATPFAEDGDKNTIPESVPAEPQNATWSAGFPSITQTPVSSGGIPPARNDFNGVLNAYGQSIAHINKGLWFEYDAEYATKIGGYPINARLMLTNGDIVQNTVANNTNNPNVNMTGWSLTKDKQIVTWSGRTQESKNRDILSVIDYGGIGDGDLHTVQEWINSGKYPSLSAIQVDYPMVSSVTDSIDWAATMKGITDIFNNGGGSLFFPHIGSKYYFNKSIEIPQYSINLSLISNGANLYFSDAARIGCSDPDSLNISGFNKIEFTELTNNGISIARPKNTTVDVNQVVGAGNFLVIFFATDDLSSQCYNNLIRVKNADGLNVSKGGLGMAAMSLSRIEGVVKNIKQGIGYAVNFKNNCIACSCDVITSNNKYGLVISNDTGAGTGTGVNSSTFDVVSVGDEIGHSMHRAQRNTVNINYTGTASASNYAVYVAAFCQDNTYNIQAYNGNSSGYIFYTRSDKQDFNVVDTDYSFGKVGYFDSNTDYCNVLLSHKYSFTGNGASIENLFFIDPTCDNITLQNLADAPNVIHKYDSATTTESWQQGRVHLPNVGDDRASSYMTVLSSGTWIVRTKGVDVFSYNATNKSLDFVNDDTSLGRSGRSLTSAWTRRVMYTATIGDFYGSNSPEGVLTAGISSTYRRSNGGANTTFYVKESGTGNTGWVAK